MIVFERFYKSFFNYYGKKPAFFLNEQLMKISRHKSFELLSNFIENLAVFIEFLTCFYCVFAINNYLVTILVQISPACSICVNFGKPC